MWQNKEFVHLHFCLNDIPLKVLLRQTLQTYKSPLFIIKSLFPLSFFVQIRYKKIRFLLPQGCNVDVLSDVLLENLFITSTIQLVDLLFFVYLNEMTLISCFHF